MKNFVSALALIAASPALAQQQPSTVTNMPFASTPLSGSELLYIVQGGQPRKTTVGGLGFAPINSPTFTGTVTLPGGGLATPHVANNTALQAIVPTAPGQVYVRDGFYAAGDGGGATYTSAAGACSTPDNGAQVQPTGTAYCWTLATTGTADIRVWGAFPNQSGDSAPAIRNAAYWASQTHGKLFAPGGNYNLNTLDTTQGSIGALVAGSRPVTTTSAGASTNATSITVTNATGFAGPTGNNYNLASNLGVQLANGETFNDIVQSVSGNTISFSTPLPSAVNANAPVWNYAPNQQPDSTFEIDGPKAVGNAIDCGGDAPYFKLGPALNRPLLYVLPEIQNPRFYGVCMDGNLANQTGWSAGPNGELFLTEIAQTNHARFESAIVFDYSVMTGGYGGLLSLGGARGTLWSHDSWFLYSGHLNSDIAILLGGYDSTFWNPQVGENDGFGWSFVAGSQYQIIGGATFENYSGVNIFGGYVPYMSFATHNFQANNCGAVYDNSTAGAGVGAVHSFTDVTFDANSRNATGSGPGTGICPDITSNGSTYITLDNPHFIDSSPTIFPKVTYNIQTGGTGYVSVSNWTNLTSYNTAFADYPATVRCWGCNVEFAWTPTVSGTSTAGSPTYYFQQGTWSRAGNEITAKFRLQTTAFSGAAGNVQVGGLPFVSSATAFGGCTFTQIYGLTFDTGYSQVGGVVGTTASTAIVYENGSNKTGQPLPVSGAGAAVILQGFCTYSVDQ